MKRLNLDVDDDLFSDFKAHCARKGRTMREEVLSLISFALKKGVVPFEGESESDRAVPRLAGLSKEETGTSAPIAKFMGKDGQWHPVESVGTVGEEASDESKEVAVPPFLRLRKEQESQTDLRDPRTEFYRRIARRRFESKPLLERFEDLRGLRLSENAMWLALLIDTEGAMGWYTYLEKVNRINEEWKYQYNYVSPYINLGMRKLESERTVDKAGRLMGKAPISRVKEPFGEVVEVAVEKGRAVAVAIYIKPYLDKFGRMAELLTVLFKHRTHAPADKFNQALTYLFANPVSPKQANEILLSVDETTFRRVMEEAEKQADLHLT